MSADTTTTEAPVTDGILLTEVAAAKAAIEDYARAMRPTRVRLADVTAQLEASVKQLKDLKAAQETATRDLATATAARIEALVGVPIDVISTGPDRAQTIVRRHPFG